MLFSTPLLDPIDPFILAPLQYKHTKVEDLFFPQGVSGGCEMRVTFANDAKEFSARAESRCMNRHRWGIAMSEWSMACKVQQSQCNPLQKSPCKAQHPMIHWVWRGIHLSKWHTRLNFLYQVLATSQIKIWLSDTAEATDSGISSASWGGGRRTMGVAVAVAVALAVAVLWIKLSDFQMSGCAQKFISKSQKLLDWRPALTAV